MIIDVASSQIATLQARFAERERQAYAECRTMLASTDANVARRWREEYRLSRSVVRDCRLALGHISSKLPGDRDRARSRCARLILEIGIGIAAPTPTTPTGSRS